MGKSWPSEQFDQLKVLVSNTKMSARQMGDIIGVTRCAIIGKLRREGMQLPCSAGNRPAAKKHDARYRMAKPKPRVRASPIEDATPPRLEGHEPVAFIDLVKGQCQYCVEPLDTPVTYRMMCCGAPVVDRNLRVGLGKSYCAFHFDACTVERK